MSAEQVPEGLREWAAQRGWVHHEWRFLDYEPVPGKLPDTYESVEGDVVLYPIPGRFPPNLPYGCYLVGTRKTTATEDGDEIVFCHAGILPSAGPQIDD